MAACRGMLAHSGKVARFWTVGWTEPCWGQAWLAVVCCGGVGRRMEVDWRKKRPHGGGVKGKPPGATLGQYL